MYLSTPPSSSFGVRIENHLYKISSTLQCLSGKRSFDLELHLKLLYNVPLVQSQGLDNKSFTNHQWAAPGWNWSLYECVTVIPKERTGRLLVRHRLENKGQTIDDRGGGGGGSRAVFLQVKFFTQDVPGWKKISLRYGQLNFFYRDIAIKIFFFQFCPSPPPITNGPSLSRLLMKCQSNGYRGTQGIHSHQYIWTGTLVPLQR